MRRLHPLVMLVVLLLAMLVVGLFTNVQASAPAPAPAPAPYPGWLHMEPGYAQACMAGGGCVPMTLQELQQIALVATMRERERCRGDI